VTSPTGGANYYLQSPKGRFFGKIKDMEIINQAKEFKKRLVGNWGKYTIYLVDDEAVRNSAESAQNFGDFGVNLAQGGLRVINFSFIPKNEIWIAKSVKFSERRFVIDYTLAYVRNVERGLSSDKADDKAMAEEKSSRAKGALEEFHLKKGQSLKNIPRSEVAKKVYLHKYLTLQDDKEKVKIYLIDGQIVRDLYKTDYVEGGHGYVYTWIPKDEIWIDNTLNKEEMPVIVLHEFVERTLMKHKHLSYNKSHHFASKVEFEHRGIFNKQALKNVNKEVVFEKLLMGYDYKHWYV
jgi:hypothetical protein